MFSPMRRMYNRMSCARSFHSEVAQRCTAAKSVLMVLSSSSLDILAVPWICRGRLLLPAFSRSTYLLCMLLDLMKKQRLDAVCAVKRCARRKIATTIDEQLIKGLVC